MNRTVPAAHSLVGHAPCVEGADQVLMHKFVSLGFLHA